MTVYTQQPLAVEPFLEGTMYLVALADYPAGIWFFNEEENPEGLFVELKPQDAHRK
nr:hypothetical protein [Candidatus Symbiopectobacterium sp. NZEC135]